MRGWPQHRTPAKPWREDYVAEDTYNALTWNHPEQEQENLTWQVQADLAELEWPAAEESAPANSRAPLRTGAQTSMPAD